MTYTIGTAHGPFTGTGSFAIAKPAGIRTIVTNIPSWTHHDAALPLRYYRLARFSLGNVHGFENSREIEYQQQLVYPIPAVWELLAYDIRDGASCTFYELVDVPDLTLKQPWDRTPSPVVQAFIGAVNGGTALTTGFSYTVPTGRRFRLTRLMLMMNRYIVATASQQAVGGIYLNGTVLGFLSYSGNVLGAPYVDAGAISELILNAGNVLSGSYANYDTGGSIHMQIGFDGYLFDA